MSRAVADFVVADLSRDEVVHTPTGVDDVTASTLAVAASAASAALSAAGVTNGDTILIGGAAGGVGVFAVQLAKLAGARVIGTASPSSFDFVRSLGAEPVEYGDGLVERVSALAPEGLTAAADLFGTEAASVALELGVARERVSTIAAPGADLGVQATGGIDAAPGTLQQVADLIAAGSLVVPIAARYPIEQVQEAVALQASRHARGKVVITT